MSESDLTFVTIANHMCVSKQKFSPKQIFVVIFLSVKFGFSLSANSPIYGPGKKHGFSNFFSELMTVNSPFIIL